MTDSIRTITLQAGTRFTECLPSDSCKDGYTVNTLRTGELKVSVNAGIPENATFYYPDIQTCENVRDPQGPDDRRCDLIAVFDGADLTSLSQANPEVARFVNELSNEMKATSEGQASKSGESSESPAPLFQPQNPLLKTGLLSGLALLVLLVIYLLVRRRKPEIRYTVSRSRKGGSNLNPATSLNNTDQSVVDEVRRQLTPVIERMNRLAVRLEGIETELISISQKKEIPTLATTIFRTTQPPQPEQSQDQPKLRDIRPLDINLIREAVLSADYTLISSHPHYFVTETLDSRQGKDDVVRFSIDGNQNDSDKRSQSEFIAIPYSEHTYIIPNLLPNASDPSRTIKRHIDRNKVYRGDGHNLLSLSELAIVERSGDSYVLKKSGRVG